LAAIQQRIRERLSEHADGKNLKGNELVGWLGEIYGKILFDGRLVSDDKEHDFSLGMVAVSQSRPEKGAPKDGSRPVRSRESMATIVLHTCCLSISMMTTQSIEYGY
jgi:hypothetical protein